MVKPKNPVWESQNTLQLIYFPVKFGAVWYLQLLFSKDDYMGRLGTNSVL